MKADQIIESIIFISEAPVLPAQILELWENEVFEAHPMNEELLTEALGRLMEKYADPQFPFEMRIIDGGYQLFTKREYFPFLRHAVLLKNQKRLGRSALETLSIIAYRQPVTKAELEFIRGVGCDYSIHKLLEKKLIDIQGRSDAPGRPLLYGTSPYFMEYFGLKDLNDLPKLEELKVDEVEYQAQFKVFLDEKDGNEEAGT